MTIMYLRAKTDDKLAEFAIGREGKPNNNEISINGPFSNEPGKFIVGNCNQTSLPNKFSEIL